MLLMRLVARNPHAIYKGVLMLPWKFFGKDFAVVRRSAIPRPRMSFRSGEPKQVLMAILDCPALATARSAIKSPTLFPRARTVRPRIEVEIPSMTYFSNSTMMKISRKGGRKNEEGRKAAE